ncbi:unnamed protein product [Effrenium voratum]|nr:unnamed protein product [Effrenium voratum]
MLQDILKHWRFQEKLEEFGAWDLSLLLIAFARASMRDKESVVAVGTALRQRSSDLTASTAAGSLYSLALLDFTDETGTFLAAKVLPRCLGHASQQELVNIAFALVVLDLPGAELFSFTLERLARQVSSLKPVEVHALRIVAHCVKFPDALQPAMRSSLEAPEARQRSTEALKQVLRATQNQVIECPPMSSRLQWALERYLDELRLPYVPEQAVGPYIPDFILPMNVAVEVDGFKHFYAYSQRLTAKSQLKRRILRAMGWGIVSLPHFVWLPMKHEEVTDGRPTCHPPSARNAEVDRVDAAGLKVLMQHQERKLAQVDLHSVEDYKSHVGPRDRNEIRAAYLAKFGIKVETKFESIGAGHQRYWVSLVSMRESGRFESDLICCASSQGTSAEDDTETDCDVAKAATKERVSQDEAKITDDELASLSQADDAMHAEVEEPPDALEVSVEDFAEVDAAAAKAFLPGVYVTSSICRVSESAELVDLRPNDVIKEFQAGSFIHVLKVVLLLERRLLRALLAQPAGWITLRDLRLYQSFAEMASPSSQVEYHLLRHDGTDELEDVEPLYSRKVCQGSPPCKRCSRCKQKAVCVELDGERYVYNAGSYILLRPAYASPTSTNFDPDDEELVAVFEEGQEIELTEIIHFEEMQRVRACVAPEGWITLANTRTGARWAVAKDAADLPEEVAAEASREVEPSEPASRASEPEYQRPNDSGDRAAQRKQPVSVQLDGRMYVFGAGSYLMLRAADASPSATNLEPDDNELVTELEEGQEVKLTDIVHLPEMQRVRARLDPFGWITLANTSTGDRWAVAREDLAELPAEASHEVEPSEPASRASEESNYQQWPDRDDRAVPRNQRHVSVKLEGVECVLAAGRYILLRPANASPALDNIDPDNDEIVAELEEGQAIELTEIVYLEEMQRVRARLDPEGWITLANTSTGVCWAVAREDDSAELPAEASHEVEPSEPASRASEVDPSEPASPRARFCCRKLRAGAACVRILPAEASHEVEPSEPASRALEDVEYRQRPHESGDRIAPRKQTAVSVNLDGREHVFAAGSYVLVRPAYASPALDNIDPDDDELVAELEEGQSIELTEIVYLEEMQRVRARLDPEGWITLANTSTGVCWAVAREESAEMAAEDASREEAEPSEPASRASEVDPSEPASPVSEVVHRQRPADRGDGAAPRKPTPVFINLDGRERVFAAGSYVLVRPAYASSALDNIDPDDDELVAELEEGQSIELTEIVYLEEMQRVRARLDPEGWITLANTSTGVCWAVAREESAEMAAEDASREEVEPSEPASRASEVDPSEPASPVSEVVYHQRPDDRGDGAAPRKQTPVFVNLDGRERVFAAGSYVLVRPAYASSALDNIDPDDDELVAELEEGQSIELTEIVYLEEMQRVRARLDPEGWITLANASTGVCWAVAREDTVSDTEDLPPMTPEAEQSVHASHTSEAGEEPVLLPQGARSVKLDGKDYVFATGWYIVLRPAYASPSAANVDPDDSELVAEFDEGQEIKLTKIVYLEERARVDPEGWITLANTRTGGRWAKAREVESDNESEFVRRKEQAEEVSRYSTLAIPWLELTFGDGAFSYKPGAYVLLRPAFVAPDATTLDPDDEDILAELEERQEVVISEIQEVEKRLRAPQSALRGRLKDSGWITLVNLRSGLRAAIGKADWKSWRSIQDARDANSDVSSSSALRGSSERESVNIQNISTEPMINERTVFVSPSCENLDPDDDEIVDELEEGMVKSETDILAFRHEGWHGLLTVANALLDISSDISGSSALDWDPKFPHWQSEPKPPEWKGMVVSPDVGSIYADHDFCVSTSSAIAPKAPSPRFALTPSEGAYVLLQRTAVSAEANEFHPSGSDLVDELQQGQEVAVVEVLEMRYAHRVRSPQRARLADPEGWITLVESGVQRAVSRSEWHSDPASLQDDGPGLYALRTVFVSPSCENIDPDEDEIVDELEEGRLVRIQEVAHLQNELRLRARLAHPDGWITLVNLQNGRRWALKADESQPEQPGLYELLAPVTVAASCNLLVPNEEQVVDDLERNTKVKVVEVVKLEREQRIRGSATSNEVQDSASGTLEAIHRRENSPDAAVHAEFTEQLLEGLHLTLSMEGVCLDMKVRLNESSALADVRGGLELSINQVQKRIALNSIRQADDSQIRFDERAVKSLCRGRSLPRHGRGVYFSERLYLGWLEMICCPEVSGCNIRTYDDRDPYGGNVEYTIMRSISYSPYVPRFVMEVRDPTIPRPAVVGRLEKLDTVLRAKTGEFLCVNLWKFIVNGLTWTNSSHRGVMASDHDAFVLHMAVSTQAKIDFDRPSDVEWVLNRDTERWVQTISTDNNKISIWCKKTMQKSLHDMQELQFSYEGQTVGTAKQQNFGEVGAKGFRPYLGVQLDAKTLEEKLEKNQERFAEDADVVPHLLTTESVAMVLISLAWSHNTLATSPSDEKTWKNFVEAMRSHPDEPNSGQMKGYPPDWSVLDVKKYLAETGSWLKLHSRRTQISTKADGAGIQRDQTEVECGERSPTDLGTAYRFQTPQLRLLGPTTPHLVTVQDDGEIVIHVSEVEGGSSLELGKVRREAATRSWAFAAWKQPRSNARRVALQGIEFYAFTLPHENTFQDGSDPAMQGSYWWWITGRWSEALKHRSDKKVSLYSKDAEGAPRDRASLLAGAQDALFSAPSNEVRHQGTLLEGDEEASETWDENGAEYPEEDHAEEDPEDDEAVYLSEAYREWEKHYLRRIAMRIHRLLTAELDRSEEALFAIFVQHDANLDGRVRGEEASLLLQAIEDAAPGSTTESTPARKDGSISLVSLLRWYSSHEQSSSYTFGATALLTSMLGSGMVGCDARIQALEWLALRKNVMGYRRLYSQLRELKEERLLTALQEKETQLGLRETMPEYYKLLAKEFEGDMELLFELFCEVDESNNLLLEEREDQTCHGLRALLKEIEAPMAEDAPSPGLEEVKKKKISILGFQVQIAEHKVKKVLVGATSFLIVFNSLALPFALPKLRRFLGAPYVPMKRKAVEARAFAKGLRFDRSEELKLAISAPRASGRQLAMWVADLVEFLTALEGGRLRCCARLLRQLGRQPRPGGSGPAQLRELRCQLPEVLKGDLVWWERLVTLDLANTLELFSGLRGCRALAEEEASWIETDDLAALLPPIFKQLKVVRRLSIAISLETPSAKLSAPNCLQEVGTLTSLRELYVGTDHCCLEVALLGALAQLGGLQKLWLHLGSLQYNEAVSSALVTRLPKDLEVLSIWGTARLLRDVLGALGKGKRMTKLRELDLSMNRNSPGGRITDARHGPGEVSSDQVWQVLEGAPDLEKLCLNGALAWYPPVAAAWFNQLLSRRPNRLRVLDLRQNKIRADVADWLQERLKKICGKVLFEQVLPNWAATRPNATGKGLAGLRLVDFGAGDGRIVASAAKKGMHATGFELNPYLVLWSRLRRWNALRQASGTGQLRWANSWSADLSSVDVVTVYGRPGDSFMELAARKLEELPPHAAVVSHFFDLPGWERRLVQDVEGLKLYDLSRPGPDRKPTSE